MGCILLYGPLNLKSGRWTSTSFLSCAPHKYQRYCLVYSVRNLQYGPKTQLVYIRAVIKGWGPGFFPSYFEVYPQLLSYKTSMLTSLQQLESPAIFRKSPPTSKISDTPGTCMYNVGVKVKSWPKISWDTLLNHSHSLYKVNYAHPQSVSIYFFPHNLQTCTPLLQCSWTMMNAIIVITAYGQILEQINIALGKGAQMGTVNRSICN